MRHTIFLFLLIVVISHVYSLYVDQPNNKLAEKGRGHPHHKHRRHHYRRAALSEAEEKDIYKNIEPLTKKIISETVDGFNSSTSNAYETKVTYRPGPDFYADIFKIPISVLQAVSNFLGNNVAYINSTTTPVQASISVQSGTRPKPLVLGAVSLLSPSLPSLSVETSPSSLPEAVDLSPSLQEADYVPSSVPEAASGMSSSPEIVASPRQ